VSAPRRLGVGVRLATVAAAIAVAFLVHDRYGMHAVDLYLALPDASPGRTGVEVRVTRPDGRFVVAFETSEPSAGKSAIVHAHLPHGDFHLDVVLLPSLRAYAGDVHFAGEESLDVELHPR
jgi:hypothetical protein